MSSVFLVDDDPVFLMLGRKLLGKLGGYAPVDSFPDGQRALDELRRRSSAQQPPPDLILLDIRMPILDGFGLLDALATLPEAFRKPIRVIMVSSSLDPAERARAFASPNVVAFLDKPLERERLLPLLSP